MQLRLSLSQKALLLVVIPLSAELIFIGVLGFLLKQLEIDAGRIERSRAMIGGVSNITSLIMEASTSVLGYNLNKSPLFASSYERRVKRIPEELQILRRVAAKNSKDASDIEEIAKIAEHGMDLLEQSKRRADSSGLAIDLLSGSNLSHEVQVTLGELSSAVDKSIARQRKIENINPEVEARTREFVEIWLIAGIVLNLVLAAALIFFFNRSTSRRLNLLMDNTHRLARAEELCPPVGGYDEISELDKTFRDMAAALNESNRLKQEFLEMVSHDVRTPLTAVLMIIDSLRLGYLKPEAVPAKLDAGKKNLNQVIALLNELLDIHRMESGKLQLQFVETGAAEVLEEAIETVKPLAQNAGVTFTLADNPVSVRCDPDRLRQVFINLISNALKYSPANTRIDTLIEVDDNWIKMIIRDQGPGVPDEFKTRIFDRFQQIRASDEKIKGGRGLGLAICKTIVEEHGGKIGVADAPAGGSDFWVLLPKLKPKEEQAKTS